MKTILKIMAVIAVTVIMAGSSCYGQTISSQKGLTSGLFAIGGLPGGEIVNIHSIINPGPPSLDVINPGDIIRFTETINNITVGALVSFDVVAALNDPDHPLGIKAVNIVMISQGQVITGSLGGNISIGTDQAYLVKSTGTVSGNVNINGGTLVVIGGKAAGNISLGSNSTIICKDNATVSGGSF